MLAFARPHNPMFRRATISLRAGKPRTGATIIRGCKPSKPNMIPTGCSSRTMAWAAKRGAPMASRAAKAYRHRRRRRPELPPVSRSRSLLRQSRFAQSVEGILQHRLVLVEPLDGEVGIKAAGFGHGALSVVHLAFERMGRGQVKVSVKDTISALDCLVTFVDHGVEMSEAEFGVSHQVMPPAYR